MVMKNIKFIITLIAVGYVGTTQTLETQVRDLPRDGAYVNRTHGPEINYHILLTPAWKNYRAAQNNFYEVKTAALEQESAIRKDYLSKNYPIYKQWLKAINDQGFKELGSYKAQEEAIEQAQQASNEAYNELQNSFNLHRLPRHGASHSMIPTVK